MDTFLTTTQAAEFLNISNVTLKKFIAAGRIKSFRTPGGHYRIHKKDLFHDLYDSNHRTDTKGDRS